MITTSEELKTIKESVSSLKSEVLELERTKASLENKINALNRDLSDVNDGRSKRLSIAIISVLALIIGITTYDSLDPSLFSSILICCGTLVLALQFAVPYNFKKEYKSEMNKLKPRLKSVSSRLKHRQEELIQLEDNYEKQVKKHENELLIKVNDLKSFLDSNQDNTIDVIQHDNEFMKLLQLHERKIIVLEKSEGKDYLKQFVRLSDYLINKEHSLQNLFNRINEIYSIRKFDLFKNNLIDQIQLYNLIRMNALQMITSLVKDERILFYRIYEKFDSLGVWHGSFEKGLLNKLDLLNANLDSLVSEISEMSNTINNSINELIMITENNTTLLSSELKEIDSTLQASNLISAINTYQNYRTRKKLS